jgi:replicative DNA helicase
MSAEYVAKEIILIDWQQKIGQTLGDIAKKIYMRKPFEATGPLIDALDGVVFEAHNTNPKGQTKEPNELIEALIVKIERRVEDSRDGKVRGISSGFSLLDAKMQGFCPNRYYVIAARTSIGKTTLAINLMRSAIKAGKACLYFTVEMTDDEIAEKYLARDAGVDSNQIQNGALNNDEYDFVFASMKEFASLQGRVNNVFCRSFEKLEAETKRLHKQGKVGMVIIDYLQQISIESKQFSSRHAELTEISARLKLMAQTLEIPVVVLAQVNRQAMATSSASEDGPQLHQIKDCGSIEQDADVVIFLHRDSDNNYFLMVAKNRYGEIGRIHIEADLRTSCFREASNGLEPVRTRKTKADRGQPYAD